jgi:hypothetical protein
MAPDARYNSTSFIPIFAKTSTNDQEGKKGRKIFMLKKNITQTGLQESSLGDSIYSIHSKH